MDKHFVGFWWRGLAAVIDAAVVTVILVALVGGILPLFGVALLETSGNAKTHPLAWVVVLQVIPWTINVVYEGTMQASGMQATLGKMVVGAVVVDLEGERIGHGQSFLRALCKIPSAVVLGLGCLVALFTPSKQGLHDIMAGTLVMKRQVIREAVGARG